VLRLSNAECIAWEASPTGTDFTLCGDASGRIAATTFVGALVGNATTASSASDLTGTNIIGATEINDLDVASGGTGAATLTGLLQGNGTSAFTAITDSITAGQVLRVTGSNTYAWGALDLADTDAITGDIPDGNLSANVSLLGSSIGSGEVDAGSIDSGELATANKTLVKSITILTPTTGETNKVQWYWPAAVTLTKVECSVGAATSVTIQLDERAVATPNTAGTDSLTGTLACDVDSQSTTSFSDSAIAAAVPHNLQIVSVSGTPEVVRIHVTATIN